MRIFLTGGSGYIGSAVLDALTRAGHHVTAVVRNGEKAAAVDKRGGHPLTADLFEPESYAATAASAEAWIHTAIDMSARGPELDTLTVDTLLTAARSAGGGLFIYTSGVWVLGETPEPATEKTKVNPIPHSAWRAPIEKAVIKAASGAIRTAVVRPGIVYGGGRGIVGDVLKDANRGLVRVIGSGENHWPLVYDRDLGDLYARLIASPDAKGIYHANDEGDERVNDIVEAIREAAHVRPSLRHVPLAEARTKMGTYADALALDQRVRSPRARALGWTPSLRSVAGNVSRLFDEYRRATAAESTARR
ncbi:MAG TPA: NAD-dependent epimerase/dehydratase family protein [Vicinamibacterales bacterium]|nr:NAD-dependent epimerase/dehydratase family protein [Vicinamibacterales bacterium]